MKNPVSDDPKKSDREQYDGLRRIIRGGNWVYDPPPIGSAHRSNGGPCIRYNLIGFRVVRNKPKSKK
tara:strand:- start:764 stop:964 length:201 start_codon:yes stop_codon:yes gene_type:complete